MLLACVFSAQAHEWKFGIQDGRPTWITDNFLVIKTRDTFSLYQLNTGTLGNWGWDQTTWDKVADFDSLLKAESYGCSTSNS